MRGSLGEKIGEGAMADTHAWAPGKVLKLFKVGVPRWVGEHESRMTRAAFAAGAPAPEVFDEVSLDGRFGMVLPRLDGPTLLQRLIARATTSQEAGEIIARLFLSIHATAPPPEVASLHEWIDAASRLSDGKLPEHVTRGVHVLIDRLPPANGLCHADLHPGNVIMTAEGPRIIDWTSAVRAPAALDLGRCHLTFTELVDVPEGVDPAEPRALEAAVQAEYARLAGISPAALTAAMAPYFPILRAFALIEHTTGPERRARLIQQIEAAIHSAET